MQIDQLINDAAGPLAEVMKGLSAMGIGTDGLQIRYRRERVVITLDGNAAQRAEFVWELLIFEFKNAGWGYGTRFDNGIDQPRTQMTFDHPSTLTRW